MKKLLALSFFIVLLSGCATTPVSTDLAVNVPAKRIYNNDLFIKKDNSGTVIIKRDAGIVSSACSDKVFVDGILVADINPSEKIVIYPQKGKRIFSMKPNGICGGGLTEVEGEVIENETLIYRLAHGLNDGPGIYRTAF